MDSAKDKSTLYDGNEHERERRYIERWIEFTTRLSLLQNSRGWTGRREAEPLARLRCRCKARREAISSTLGTHLPRGLTTHSAS